jgi:hypothetical protein
MASTALPLMRLRHAAGRKRTEQDSYTKPLCVKRLAAQAGRLSFEGVIDPYEQLFGNAPAGGPFDDAQVICDNSLDLNHS